MTEITRVDPHRFNSVTLALELHKEFWRLNGDHPEWRETDPLARDQWIHEAQRILDRLAQDGVIGGEGLYKETGPCTFVSDVPRRATARRRSKSRARTAMVAKKTYRPKD